MSKSIENTMMQSCIDTAMINIKLRTIVLCRSLKEYGETMDAVSNDLPKFLFSLKNEMRQEDFSQIIPTDDDFVSLKIISRAQFYRRRKKHD